ncbi:MAG: NADH-quinone oxidoreductase subunit M [Candidatus Thorarchaeota archaeon]|nr:NADH-quinone oxidoreductase subunit M [Candidatus Thorarchaeota archaeon]
MQFVFAQSIINAIESSIGILPLMLLLPLVATPIAYLLGNKGARPLVMLVTLVELALSLILALAFDPSHLPADTAGMVYTGSYTLTTIDLGGIATSFQIAWGVDGISVAMVILANLVVFIAALSSNHISKSKGLYYSLFMLLHVGLLGVFVSTDLLGFFIFWELVLIPMFFIIGKWGEEGCEHAAIKFFIYTHLGSAVMLIAFFVLFYVSGAYTFSMIVLRGTTLAPMVQVGFALAVFLGAGVKLPVFPLHNWLPWAHVKAPTPGSVILAGILLKMGGYGFIRLGLWLVPDAFARLAIPFAVLAVFTCIYMAFVAMAQSDLKSMVAYTSVNHMAWVLLGVAVGSELAIQGAIFMMFSHGMISSVMFIAAGQLKYSTGTRMIPEVSGLQTKAPKFSAILILSSLAAFGLPGFSGFIAEILVLFGSVPVYIWSGLIGLGLFVTVGYLLWMLNRIVFSDPDPESEITEAPWSDLIAPILMLIPIFLLGIWPDLVLELITPAVTFILGG